MEPREARGRPDERLLRLPHRETAAGTERPLERRLGLFTEPATDGNEALRVVRHGKGVLVFWQTPPWTIDADAKPYLRTTKRRANAMLARLMGNLGFVSTALSVRYGDVPVAEDDPYRYYRW